MRILFLSRRQIRSILIVCAVVAAAAFVAKVADTAARLTLGVKPGVTVDGVQVGGMLRHELRDVIRQLALARSQPARNAMYYPESGEIIEGRDGREVDVEETVRRILQCPPNTRVPLAIHVITPDVTSEFFKPVYQGASGRPEVALCINVAWGQEYLPAILDILEREKVKATFFFVGTWVRQYPELVRRVAEAGHCVANHGLYHGHPTQMGRGELQRLITENQAMLEKAAGVPLEKIFAPPYGEVNDQVAAVAAALGYRTIMWTLDTVDWKRPVPEIIVARACDRAGPGTIVLMHPTSPTVVAIPRIIQRMRAKELKLVTIPEMLKP